MNLSVNCTYISDLVFEIVCVVAVLQDHGKVLLLFGVVQALNYPIMVHLVVNSALDLSLHSLIWAEELDFVDLLFDVELRIRIQTVSGHSYNEVK